MVDEPFILQFHSSRSRVNRDRLIFCFVAIIVAIIVYLIIVNNFSKSDKNYDDNNDNHRTIESTGCGLLPNHRVSLINYKF